MGREPSSSHSLEKFFYKKRWRVRNTTITELEILNIHGKELLKELHIEGQRWESRLRFLNATSQYGISVSDPQLAAQIQQDAEANLTKVRLQRELIEQTVKSFDKRRKELACPECGGAGNTRHVIRLPGISPFPEYRGCPACNGTGASQ